MKLTLDKIMERIDLEAQLEKCDKCPCVDDQGNFKGCFSCQHRGKDCAEDNHNCGDSYINHPDTLSLCSSDDCALTWVGIQLLAAQEKI